MSVTHSTIAFYSISTSCCYLISQRGTKKDKIIVISNFFWYLKSLAMNFSELNIVSWMNITLKTKRPVSLFLFILYVSYLENSLEGNELLM